jgi:O-antigen/teichoic acid export membrane protein
MERLERNIFANLAGVIWAAALGLLSIPFYLKFMGTEAFGLIGVFLTLQSVFVIFDLGISATLCREVARIQAHVQRIQQQRDYVFTLQFIHWLIALTIGAAVFLLAPMIAHYWITPQSLSVNELTGCIQLMGITMALQFPFTFYQGGLLGLQKQFLFNAIAAINVSIKVFGTLLILHFISPAPKVFFACQAVSAAIGTLIISFALWKCLPKLNGDKPQFRVELLSRVWRFSASYAANSVATLGLFQMDKIVLSKLLTLEMFGYYALAKGIVGGLYALIVAVNSAIFPQLSNLVAGGNEADLSRIYHRSCQLMSVILLPSAVTTALFSREILFLWTGDLAIVENTHVILSLLIVAMLLYGLTQPLFCLQVAYGWWKLISGINICVLTAIIPFYIVMARTAQAPGVATVVLLANIIYMFTLPLMHRRYLQGQQWQWIVKDVGFPLIGTLAVAGILYVIYPGGLSRFETLAYLGFVGILSTLSAALLSSHIKPLISSKLRELSATVI